MLHTIAFLLSFSSFQTLILHLLKYEGTGTYGHIDDITIPKDIFGLKEEGRSFYFCKAVDLYCGEQRIICRKFN